MSGAALPAGLADFSLAGRVALVTGSSRGIGLALARGLGAAGARVVLNGRDTDALASAAAGFGPVEPATFAFDVTDEDQVTDAIDAIEADVGPIEILVNNTGIQHRAPLLDLALEDWQRVIETNLTSAFIVGRACARKMVARSRGSIVNIGSVQTALGRPTIAPYAASKGGLKLLTQSMCAEWAGSGLQVNSVAPGYFKTELTSALVADAEFSAWVAQRTPAGRWGDVEELVGATVFLASDAARFVNGHTLFVDGGMTAVV